MKITLFSIILCCYYCIYITHASPKCLEDQQSLLLQLKNNLTFHPENSTKLILWNKTTACCNWSGVTCDIEGYVVGLELYGEDISGGLSSLFNFQHLQKLNLADNNFNSSIPSGFNKLEKLTYLDLSNNEFVGQIPIEIFQLTRLVHLDLSYSKFYGTIPNSISNLTRLVDLDLSHCKFYGSLPNSMSNLTMLEVLDLSYNDLSGAIPSSIPNLTHLSSIDLTHNYLSGAIPSSLFTLPSIWSILLASNRFVKIDEFINVSSSGVEFLDLSRNNLSGSLPNEILLLRYLDDLDLSYNNISINVNDANADQTFLPQITFLTLTSCNLKTFPRFLMNQSTLISLDLSVNQMQGVVPNWIWTLSSIQKLIISHNFLTELEGPLHNLTSAFMDYIDLHNNQLQGQVPVFLKWTYYMDYSMNKFSSVIPVDTGNYPFVTYFLSLSHNNFHESIPNFLCNASNLHVLGLSFNNFSGAIPSCLLTMTKTLMILDLRRNNLQGQILDKFPASCALETLNLHGNLLHGPVPKSLAHCSKLKLLDIGTNQIDDFFPCFLKNIPTLSVLVLRNNKFRGTLRCSKAKNPWKMIQIVDIAFNSFSGELPEKYFRTLKKMKHVNDNVAAKFIGFGDDFYYQESVPVMSKGQQMELVKILTIFTTIDFSSNHFEGAIPKDLMDLKALYILNFSNNAFSGEIPSTIGNLKQLESLDFSNNSLVGEIPVQLASLSFLSYLNLSLNHLVGKIPTGTQLQSFQASSFEGNDGLYGPPLTETPNGKRQDELHPRPASVPSSSIDWNFLSVELGFIFGLGIIIGPILFWKKWRVSYWKLVDKILCLIFRRMYFEYATDGGQTYRILRW